MLLLVRPMLCKRCLNLLGPVLAMCTGNLQMVHVAQSQQHYTHAAGVQHLEVNSWVIWTEQL
jgi:hypothetical protein